MNQWDNIYKKEGKYFLTPHEHMKELLAIFKKNKVKRILDLGCGSGRHVEFFAKQGFEVYGIDLAESGLNILKKSLAEKKLSAHLKLGNVYKRLPYKDNFFDAIISVRVIQHGKIAQIRKVLSEVKRILKPNGFFYVTLVGRYEKGSTRFSIVKHAKKIEHNTFVPLMGEEKGLPHHIFTKKEIAKELKNFSTLWMKKDKKNYYCVLSRKK